MRKKKKAESQTAVHTHTHTLIFTLIGIIILVIVVGIILVNKTNIIEEVQARISELSSGSDEENLESEDEEESVVDSSIEDGYYDEENKVTWHVEEDGSMCPIPDGYVGSEATGEDGISTGYVIYEGTVAVNDTNVATAKTTRNQYVWIPVPDVSQMYGTDSNGKKWGKLYIFSTSSGVTASNWTESSSGIMSISSSNGYREPDIVKEYDIDSKLKSLEIGVETTHDFLIQLEEEFNRMIESVEKYGGFYIGRYETGNLSQDTAVVMQMNTDLTGSNWYVNYKLCKTLSGENENVITGMIWGCQWYRTSIWLMESENKTIDEICDSTSWGNFTNAEFEYINSNGDKVKKNAGVNTIIPTGSTDYTKANNIYDLAGNKWEQSLLANTVYSRVLFGGGEWTASTSSVIKTGDNGGWTTASSSGGCRAILYIK